jgi:calcineurin-like phosphoesterase family protein/putative pyrroloquinoline-quinone-binding quinoprotein
MRKGHGMGTADILLRGLPRWPLIAVTAALAAIVFGKALWPVVAEAIDPQQAAVTGVVFDDRNGNGTRDADERGVRGVTVSDGVAFTETDGDGRYSLDVDTARRTTDLVFITKPAGWSVPKDEFSTPRFYRVLGQLPDGQGAQADFALLRDPRGRDDDFTFANVADPHRNGNMAAQMQSINASSKRLAFIQVSGDLTDNATDAEFGQYKAGTAASQLPVWPAVGNHEYRPGATYAERIDNYRRHVGPEWYSFDHGNRHFLVIENNGAAPFDEQFAWLERDLAEHARGRRVVVLMHQPMNVPFGSPSQYDALEDLLERYETELVLVGHEHSNDVDDEAFVRGAKHIQTNSSSYTIDHSPRGFRWVEMRGDEFTNPFRMYGVERSLVITSPTPGGEALDDVQVSAYHTSDAVREVRYRIDGRGSWRELRQSGDFTWYGDLDADRGAHSIEVRATGASGASWSESTAFRVVRDEPEPEAGADWTQFHGDAAHSGIAADVLERDLRLAWSHRTDGVMLTGSPAIVDGVVYAGTRDENGEGDSAVRAVDLESGRRRWEFRTESSVHGSPAVAGGMVYVPTLRGTLYAVDARSGRSARSRR